MNETPMPLAGKLILLIEGHAFLAGYIAEGLARAGAQILGPARTLDEANGLMGKLRLAPDAAVVSVDLFEAAGFTAGNALSRLSAPVLLIAGKARTLMPATLRHPVLTTPFAAYQVVDHIRTAVHGRPACESVTAGDPQQRGR